MILFQTEEATTLWIVKSGKQLTSEIFLKTADHFISCFLPSAMPSTEKLELPQREEDVEESSEEEEGNNEEGVALSDIDSDAERDADLVIHHKVHKDNHAALSQALSSIALPIPTLSFHVHMSVTSSEAVSIDINDDLSREQAFNKQALEAALEGRRKLLSEGIPFTRPSDYFAEMIKDDEHMEKVLLLLSGMARLTCYRSAID